MDNIEDLLRCPICYDYYTTAMMLSECSHNFCSLCIRKHFSQQKSHCPICRKSSSTVDLKNNRLLDDIVISYKTYLSSPSQLKIINNQTTKNNNKRGPDTKIKNDKSKSKSKDKDYIPDEDDEDDEVINNEEEDEEEIQQSPPKRMTTRSKSQKSPSKPTQPIAKKISPLSKRKRKSLNNNNNNNNNLDDDDNDNNNLNVINLLLPLPDKILCPTCNNTIVSKYFESHKSTCQQSHQQTISPSCQQLIVRRSTPLPKLCYSIMNIKQIRDFCKDLGLRTNGDKPTLVNRHRSYTIRHNSECDSLNPRSHQEILEELYADEDATAPTTNKRRSKSLPTILRLPPPVSPSQQQNILNLALPPPQLLPSQPIYSTFQPSPLPSPSSSSQPIPPQYQSQPFDHTKNLDSNSGDLFDRLRYQILSRH